MSPTGNALVSTAMFCLVKANEAQSLPSSLYSDWLVKFGGPAARPPGRAHARGGGERSSLPVDAEEVEQRLAVVVFNIWRRELQSMSRSAADGQTPGTVGSWHKGAWLIRIDSSGPTSSREVCFWELWFKRYISKKYSLLSQRDQITKYLTRDPLWTPRNAPVISIYLYRYLYRYIYTYSSSDLQLNLLNFLNLTVKVEPRDQDVMNAFLCSMN